MELTVWSVVDSDTLTRKSPRNTLPEKLYPLLSVFIDLYWFDSITPRDRKLVCLYACSFCRFASVCYETVVLREVYTNNALSPTTGWMSCCCYSKIGPPNAKSTVRRHISLRFSGQFIAVHHWPHGEFHVFSNESLMPFYDCLLEWSLSQCKGGGAAAVDT